MSDLAWIEQAITALLRLSDADIGERERVAEDEQSRRRRRQPRRKVCSLIGH